MDKIKEDIFNTLYEKTVSFTEAFKSSDIPEEDLHQERALIIIEYINDDKHAGKEHEEIIDELKTLFTERVSAMMEEDRTQADVSEKVLKRVNKVNDAALRYKEEFYIKPTPKELAEYMGVTENYILDTVQMSGYEIGDIDFSGD